MRRIIHWILVTVVLAAGTQYAFAQPRGRGPRPPTENKPIVPKDDTEKKILSVLQDMRENQSKGMMNISPDDGRLLRLLAEAVNAKHVVEIGTSNGYSTIWFCLALLKTGGKITTNEIDEGRAKLAQENFKRAGVEELVTIVMGDAHETIKKLEGPLDILFLDADKQGYMDYLNKLLPLVRPGGLVLAHNVVSHGGAMQDYLNAITTNPDLETLFLLREGAGVSVTLKKR
ncbi:MAG: O-methyltransferase [Planctomycetota bacterium]